jgi:hypothetical protein
LFADENFPLPVVEELRRLGHDVMTIEDAGTAGQSLTDEAVLDRAGADGRAVLSLNRKHFIRLHGTDRDHAGIVVCTFDLDFGAQAQRINAAIAAQPRLSRHLLRVNRPART